MNVMLIRLCSSSVPASGQGHQDNPGAAREASRHFYLNSPRSRAAAQEAL